MNPTFLIDNQALTLDQFEQIIRTNAKVELGKGAVQRIEAGFNYLQQKIQHSEDPIYGVNTGFGFLSDTKIPASQLKELQLNLIRSHACGIGSPIDPKLVKRMLLLKAIALAKGYSGVQVATVERLLFFYNHNILPVIYEQGSLGASGDLAPLAHLTLPLIGEGEVLVNDEVISGNCLQELFHIEPIVLHAKEGLALLNGTQFMQAFATFAVSQAERLLGKGLDIAALSLEAFDGKKSPFQANVNELRKQQGQIDVAAKMWSNLSNTERIKPYVQDPYSFRCIPQVHGASLDAIRYAKSIFERELNAVTDNPTLFPEEDDVVSAGNFHGQPLAITMDFLAIALAELGSISERRVYKLISGTRGLPAFLTKHPGLNSGFMIVQYTAASLVSQNKQLCTPASVDTIDSSNGQEDHVSMGANAATKLLRVLENTLNIHAMEWLTAAQAMDFREDWHLTPNLELLRKTLREKISFLDNDRFMHADIQTARQLLYEQLD